MLASLVALAVVVQAALIAYGIAGLGHWIYDGRNTATRGSSTGCASPGSCSG